MKELKHSKSLHINNGKVLKKSPIKASITKFKKSAKGVEN